MGIDPYPAAEYVVSAYSTDIKNEFSDDAPQRDVTIAGRIMSRRIMGKASFIELQVNKSFTKQLLLCTLNHKFAYKEKGGITSAFFLLVFGIINLSLLVSQCCRFSQCKHRGR